MWKCGKCGEEHTDDKNEFCSKCGFENTVATMTKEEAVAAIRRGIPKFASLEELTLEPPTEKESLTERLGNEVAETIFTVIIVAVAVPLLRFVFGGYGLYASVGFIVLASAFIFWRIFHRDPSDGKGLDLS